jgi:hypothetical protein
MGVTLFGILLITLAVSALIAVVIVRNGRSKALARLQEVPGPVRRSMAATCLGLESAGAGQGKGTGTLVLTDEEVAFAQWRPDRLIRVPRSAITEVDTTRSYLDKTMNADMLRIGWTAEGNPDTVAFFVRELDPWLADLGGHRGADSQP